MIRKDVVTVPIHDGAHFLVYHKNLPIGFGPTVLLCVNSIEILKFDCFGSKKGHFHFMNGERIFFTDHTVEKQIDTSICELKLYCLKTEIPLTNQLDTVYNVLHAYENKFYKHLRDTID
jgi:hypothetical protein